MSKTHNNTYNIALTFITKRAFTSTPLEALLDMLLDGTEQFLVNLEGYDECCLIHETRVMQTWEGSVSSSRAFGPLSSGPNAQIDREASKSH